MALFASRVPALLLSLSLAFALGACRPGGNGSAGSNAGSSAESGGLVVVVEVDGAAIGPATVTVGVRDDDGPVSGADVEVQGDMTHAGMVPVIDSARETEPGLYQTSSFAFDMAGDWFITAEVETADGRRAEAETFLSVAR